MISNEYSFKAELWEWQGKGAWHFVTLPIEVAEEINFLYSENKRGWGSLPVKATIGETSWNTSIFPDKKNNSFLLPIKSSIRNKANLVAGQTATILLKILT